MALHINLFDLDAEDLAEGRHQSVEYTLEKYWCKDGKDLVWGDGMKDQV